MKRLLILSLVMCAIFNAHSQLVVGSSGNVGIGTEETPFSQLSIGGPGYSFVNFNLRNTDCMLGIGVDNVPHHVGTTFGMRINSNYSDGTNYGLFSFSQSSSMRSPSIGICGSGSSVYRGAGVLGCRLDEIVTGSFSGIYGNSGEDDTPTFSYPGLYAGYFKGSIRTTDTIFARKHLSPTGTAASMPTTSTLGEDEQRNVVNQLRNIRTLHFQDNARQIEYYYGEKKDIVDAKPLDEVSYGLDAEDLMAVYPELVHKDKQGNYSVDYIELVPLLVKSINELSAEISALKGEERKQSKVATGIADDAMEIVSMSQNNPNPFSNSSVISLTIPQNVKDAAIYVYNLNGNQVARIPVEERGETNITVYASQLSAGMFIYSLVTDGKVCATRKMMVTE